MAATLVGTPDAAASGTVTTVSVNLPAGITAGDIGVAGVVYNQTNGDPATPSGWTQSSEVTFSTSMRARFYYRTMTGGESGTLSFVHPSANKQSAAVAVLRGVSGTPTLATNSGNDTNPAASVAASSVAVSLWFERGGTIPSSVGAPSGFTLHDQAFGSGGGQTCAAVASNLTPSSSSVGGGSWTPNVSNTGTITGTFAMAEAVTSTRVTKTVSTSWDVAAAPTPVSTLTYPVYAAHRGGANIGGRVENTMDAYTQSLANDTTSILLETDVGGLSGLGETGLCLTHDPDDLSTNSRYWTASTGGSVVTGVSTSKTIAEWDSYWATPRTGISGTRKPVSRWWTGTGAGFGELLVANPTRVGMPEIKGPEAETDLLASISARGLKGQTIVQAFDYATAQRVAAGGFNALWLTNSFATNSAAAVYASGIRWVGVDRTIADLAGYCTAAHAAGLKVIAYTVNSVANKDAALAAGVDGMFTDRPDLINAGGASRVTSTLSTSWAVAQRQTATTSTAWAVTQRATSTTSTSWAVAQRLVATTPNDWAVRARVTSTASSGWSVAQRVTKTTPSTWGVAQRVTATTPQTWAVRTRATSTMSQQWAVTGRVTKTLSTSWDTQSTEPTTRVSTTLATRWAVTARASSPLLTRWDVAQRTAGPTVTLGWDVRARATSTTPTRWDVATRLGTVTPSSWETRSRVATVLALSWATQARQTSTLATRWTTESEAIVGVALPRGVLTTTLPVTALVSTIPATRLETTV